MANTLRPGIGGTLRTSVKTLRGLPQLQGKLVRDAFQAGAILEAIRGLGPTRVRGGEETVLPLADARFPAHAEILSLNATLTLTAVSGSTLTQSAQVNGESFVSSMDLPTLPSSLTLGIEGGDVVWTWAGRPGPTEFGIPDFAEAANAYLERKAAEEEADPGGLVTINLTLISDSDTRVRVAARKNGFTYRLVQPQGWDNELDGTIHMDRNLQLGFGDIVEIPLDRIVPRGSRSTVAVEELRFEVGGELGPERLLGEVVPPATREFATVGDGFAVAQGFELPAALPAAECAGVALAITSLTEAELYFEIQADEGGSPASAEPLASGTLEMEASSVAGAAQWMTGRFSQPVTLVQDEGPWWIVLKQIQGVVRVALSDGDAGYLGDVRMNRGGQFWRDLRISNGPKSRGNVADTTATGSALVRLVYLPDADTASAAVEFTADVAGTGSRFGSASGSVRQKADPSADPEEVRLLFPSGTKASGLRLSVRSHAEGTLSAANLVQIYRPA